MKHIGVSTEASNWYQSTLWHTFITCISRSNCQIGRPNSPCRSKKPTITQSHRRLHNVFRLDCREKPTSRTGTQQTLAAFTEEVNRRIALLMTSLWKLTHMELIGPWWSIPRTTYVISWQMITHACWTYINDWQKPFWFNLQLPYFTF